MTDWPPPPLQRVLAGTPDFAEACLVGGCVRDRLLGIPSKDFDIEVFGLDYERLIGALRRWGRVDVVGRSFGVAKLTVAPGETYDFTLPRRDSRWLRGTGASTWHSTLDCSPVTPPPEGTSRSMP